MYSRFSGIVMGLARPPSEVMAGLKFERTTSLLILLTTTVHYLSVQVKASSFPFWRQPRPHFKCLLRCGHLFTTSLIVSVKDRELIKWGRYFGKMQVMKNELLLIRSFLTLCTDPFFCWPLASTWFILCISIFSFLPWVLLLIKKKKSMLLLESMLLHTPFMVYAFPSESIVPTCNGSKSSQCSCTFEESADKSVFFWLSTPGVWGENGSFLQPIHARCLPFPVKENQSVLWKCHCLLYYCSRFNEFMLLLYCHNLICYYKKGKKLTVQKHIFRGPQKSTRKTVRAIWNFLILYAHNYTLTILAIIGKRVTSSISPSCLK